MLDYHIHPDYSIDAKGTVEEFCEAALRKELREIAFATHLDADLGTGDCHVRVHGKLVDTLVGEWLEDYETTVRAAAKKYEDAGLKVLLGVEVDYIAGIEGILPEQFFATDFDMVLGSTHLIDHLAISDKDRASKAFKKYTKEELGEKYYAALTEAANTGLFDILSHIDLYRRFGQAFYGDGIRDIWKPYLRDLVAAMKKHDVGFEINTSPLRRGQDEPMPSVSIIKALRKEGMKTVTVGSDAHMPTDIGAGIENALHLLKSIGFQKIARFEHQKPIAFDLDKALDKSKENYAS
jgi:histidinol-phosphatase (PHP family)